MYAVGALLLVIIALLITAGCRKPPTTVTRPAAPPPKVQPAESTSATRAKLAAQLQTLAESEPPSELAMGAMCYDMEGPPQRSEYVCPACGERTLYALAKQEDEGHWSPASWQLIRTVTTELPACRRQIKEIDGLAVRLDESQFYRQCSPNAETPTLGLVINYDGEPTPHRMSGITSNDLKLIAEFLAGKAKHTGPQDGETPLKNHTERLGELLGIDVEIPGAQDDETQ